MRSQYHVPIPYFPFVLTVVDHSVHEHHDVQLIPAALDSLSPHHSAVFLFGCQVMQLLANCPLFPSVLLLLAKSIPVSLSSSNDALLAHCSGDFYFDTTNQILYLSEAKLQHVGHFIAIILQSMAYIASGNGTLVTVESWKSNLLSCFCHSRISITCCKSLRVCNLLCKLCLYFVYSASKPQSFMQTLHEAISSVSLQLFNFSFKWSTAEVWKRYLNLTHHPHTA